MHCISGEQPTSTGQMRRCAIIPGDVRRRSPAHASAPSPAESRRPERQIEKTLCERCGSRDVPDARGLALPGVRLQDRLLRLVSAAAHDRSAHASIGPGRDPTFRGAIRSRLQQLVTRSCKRTPRPRPRGRRRQIPPAAPRAGQAAGPRADRAAARSRARRSSSCRRSAALGMYDDDAPAARAGHRHRPRLRTRGADRRQRRHGQGRHLLPDHREEASARAADRAGESPALRLPRRLGRRVPAAAGGSLPRPRALRTHLLQPGADVGGTDSADCRGDGIVHGRRRLRAGDVGRNHHRPRHRHDLSRRSAAREGGDRRRGHRRRPGRRRRAHAPVGRRRLLRRGRRARAGAVPDDRLDLDRREAAAGRPRRARRAALRPGRDLRHRQRRHSQAVRRPRDHRAPRRRLTLRRVQGALRRRRW